MKAPEKNHILIALISLVLLFPVGWIYVEVAFSQEQPVPSPEMQSLEAQAGLIQEEINNLNARITMDDGRVKYLRTKIEKLQTQAQTLVRQQQMDKARAEADKKRTEVEKAKAPEKKP